MYTHAHTHTCTHIHTPLSFLSQVWKKLRETNTKYVMWISKQIIFLPVNEVEWNIRQNWITTLPRSFITLNLLSQAQNVQKWAIIASAVISVTKQTIGLLSWTLHSRKRKQKWRKYIRELCRISEGDNSAMWKNIGGKMEGKYRGDYNLISDNFSEVTLAKSWIRWEDDPQAYVGKSIFGASTKTLKFRPACMLEEEQWYQWDWIKVREEENNRNEIIR